MHRFADSGPTILSSLDAELGSWDLKQFCGGGLEWFASGLV